LKQVGAARSALRKLEKKAERAGLECQTFIKYQVEIRNILRHSGHFHHDFIITGSSGTKGTARELFGSNVEKIVRKSDVPVIVVKEDEVSFPFKNIVFVSDFIEDVSGAFEQVISIAKKCNAHIRLLRINTKTDTNSIISARGSVSVDKRTNTLLIKDTAKSIESVRRMVETLDIAVRQVVIEARMVTVRDNVKEDLGVRWGFSDQQGTDGISGTLEGANTISNGTIPSISDRLNVNLPITGAAGSIGMHVAKLANGTLLDLELTALEEENRGEIIASPRITTANQKKARIEQGTEIPYVESASSGATTVSFKKAVLSLEVTPHITPDNKVILDLIITQDTRGDTVQTGTGPAVAIDTQEIQTQVLVENGQTVVLGGIFQQQIINSVKKVPLLGDIPYLGVLFRSTSEFNEKKELLIFVTPKIQIE